MTLPWLNPFPDEWLQWVRTNRRIGWPNVHDERRKKGFWFHGTPPSVEPMNARYVTRMSYRGPGQPILFAEIPCESISQHNFGGDSGLSDLGQRITLLVTDHVEPHPEFGKIGVHWQFLYHRDGFADDVLVEKWFAGGPNFFNGVPFWWDWGEVRAGPSDDYVYRSSFEFGQDTDWNTTSTFGSLFWATCPMGRVIPLNPVVA